MTTFAPKRILSAVDFSPVSKQILEWSVRLATPFAATIEVLHADWWEPPNYFTPSQMKSLLAESKAARGELERQLEHTTRTVTGGRVPHEVYVVDGHPVPAILRRVAESAPGLLILGSHGRSGVARLMLGSVSENVVRQVDVPTLVVRGAPPATGGRVLCPVTMASRSLRYLELAAAVASAMGAHLEVLHSAEARDTDVRDAHDRLCEFVPENLRGQCEIRESVRSGNAAEQIILAAREQASDLIVIGAEHRPFLEMTAWGTTTDHVLRHSPCSVLVLPWRATGSA
jgi:nucleotide-binding universal stress UspA family protein